MFVGLADTGGDRVTWYPAGWVMKRSLESLGNCHTIICTVWNIFLIFQIYVILGYRDI